MNQLDKAGDLLSQPFLDLIDRQESMQLGRMAGSTAALLAQQINARENCHVLCITEGPAALIELHKDLCMLTKDSQNTLYFPAAHRVNESLRKQEIPAEDPTLAGQRIEAVSRLASSSESFITVASVQSIMQKIPSPALLNERTIKLTASLEIDRDKLLHDILKMNYKISDEVLEPGQACMRGCILDIWPTTSSLPFRIELMDSTIESLRRFDPADQRSLGKTDSISITPPYEMFDQETKPADSLFSYIKGRLIVLWLNYSSIREHADIFKTNSAAGTSLWSLTQIHDQTASRQHTMQMFMDDLNSRDDNLQITDAVSLLNISPSSLSASAFEETRKTVTSKIISLLNDGYSITLSAASKGSASHFFGETLISDHRIHLHQGPVSSGFGSESAKAVIISENDLVSARTPSAFRYSPLPETPNSPRRSGFRPAEITDLEPDDLVVHADHGIGIYRGINEISVGGRLQEVLTLEYAEGMTLHVPVSQAHLLSRYVGLPHHKAKLHRLGGRRWNRERASADKSIMDLAASLLELQAHRAVQPGHPFSPDKPWQRDFEAAFGYQETADQIKAIAEVKHDMEIPHPMDRLICGDAGYGKTEVAMRAAFKAVMDHKQVVLLVPTTVLAQQHYDAFSERMSAFPLTIAMLSRFCSRKEKDLVLQGITDGTIDIVIGTHAILQPGVVFKDLGLVIIDEEQRFGVEHKERLKQMRKLVDVLTMTATPIPRTLYLSMTGAREMSLIQTPPCERLAVKTIVAKNTDETIRSAVCSELNREGQVFYLHNRIMTINHVAKRLADLIPAARLAVAHGRMPAKELSEVMHQFARGDIDVLLCTTIIESGLDIPRANTILIDRADRFGISDLYQLRGRVGRSNRKAYAYLLIPEHGRMDSDARTRITAVKTFSGLAAGFNLALRDMEIRGVGNILGPEQSGHISTIGFGLYCQLLKRAVLIMKGEKAPPPVICTLKLDFISFTSADNSSARAVLPYTYIEEEKVRLGLYRKTAEAASSHDIKELREEMRDRFGPLPDEAARLIEITRLRICCADKDISELETRDDKLVITRQGKLIKEGHLFPRLKHKDPDKRLKEIFQIISRIKRN